MSDIPTMMSNAADRVKHDLGIPNLPVPPRGLDVSNLPDTDKVPRPTAESHHHLSPKALADQQARWDHAKECKKVRAAASAAIQKRREDEAAAQREQAEARRKEFEDEKRAKLLADLERKYLAAGGTRAEFERDKDEIVRAHLIAETTNPDGADARARRESARLYRDF